MLRTLSAAAGAALLVAGYAAPAAADQIADLRAAMKAAAANVQSFRMTLTSPLGITGSMTVTMKPRRVRMEFGGGPIAAEVYLIDGELYQKIGNAAWKKQKLPATPAMVDFTRMMADSAHMSIGADVLEDGIEYGSLNVELDMSAIVPSATPIPPTSMTCVYDKTTYLTRRCTNALITEVIDGYNDPVNVVVLPPAAASAIDAGVLILPGTSAPSPLPSPSPAP